MLNPTALSAAKCKLKLGILTIAFAPSVDANNVSIRCLNGEEFPNAIHLRDVLDLLDPSGMKLIERRCVGAYDPGVVDQNVLTPVHRNNVLDQPSRGHFIPNISGDGTYFGLGSKCYSLTFLWRSFERVGRARRKDQACRASLSKGPYDYSSNSSAYARDAFHERHLEGLAYWIKCYGGFVVESFGKVET